MAAHSFAKVDLPEAEYLADLTGIQSDLDCTKDFALMLQERLAADPPDYSLAEPLSTAILVRYSRAFAQGVRTPLGAEDLRQLTADQRTNHNHLRALRDKHIAHSVNCFEENTPVAHFCKERVQSEGITGVSCQHGRVSSLSSAELTAVLELTDVLLKFVADQIRHEAERLLPIVKAMPLGDVLSGGMGPFVPGRGRVDKPRQK